MILTGRSTNLWFIAAAPKSYFTEHRDYVMTILMLDTIPKANRKGILLKPFLWRGLTLKVCEGLFDSERRWWTVENGVVTQLKIFYKLHFLYY